MAKSMRCLLGHQWEVRPAGPGEYDLAGDLCPVCGNAGETLPAARNPGSTVEQTDLPAAPEWPRVPGYEILAELGKGGMGVVYKARQVALNRLVALKMIRSGAGADEDEVLRFRTEAEAVAQLRHPSIVQIYEVGDRGGASFLSMELVEGGSLDRWLKQGPLPPAPAARLVELAAEAIHHAHGQYIIHRDLKPPNILLAGGGGETPDGLTGSGGSRPPLADLVPKITDFGLAKKLDEVGPSLSGQVLGTPHYMAPEQARGAGKQAGPAADVYGLGAILYECLTGRPPFQAPDVMGVLEQVVKEEPVSVRRLQPGVPRDLETICHKCLQKAPESRYASAAALADDLKCFLAGRPIKARPVPPWERAWRWAKRNPSLAGALGAVLLTAVVAFVLIADSRNRAVRLAADNGKLAEDMKALADRTTKLAGEKAAALEEEKRQRQRAEWQIYRDQIATVFRALRENKPGLAGQTLDACRWDFRGWEYYFARRQLDGARLIIDHPGKLHDVLAFSGDGKRLAVGCGDHFQVYDARTGERLLRCGGLTAPVTRIAFAPDDTFLVSASNDGVAQVWDRAGKKGRFAEQKEPIVCLAISPDSKTVATGDTTGAVMVWDPQMREGPKRFKDHTDAVVLLAFSPGARNSRRGELLSLDKAGKLVRRDLGMSAGQPPSESLAGPKAAAISHDGLHLALLCEYGGRGVIYCRDLRSTRWDPAVEAPPNTQGVAFGPGGELVAATPESIRLLDRGTGRERGRLWVGATEALVSFTVSPDGGTVAASAGSMEDSGTVKLWDLREELKRVIPRTRENPTLSLGIIQAAYSRDGRFAVVARSNIPVNALRNVPLIGEVSFYTLPALQEKVLSTIGPVGSIAVSPDSRWVVAGPRFGPPVLLEVPSGKRLRDLPPHAGGVTATAFSPDGTLVATGGADAIIRLSDPSSGATVRTLQGHTGAVTALAFSPDGKLLASGGADATVRIWDLKTGKAKILRGHGAEVSSLAFGPGGRRLASGSSDLVIRLWEVASGKPGWMARQTPEVSEKTPRLARSLFGERQTFCLVFTPDGKRVVSLAPENLPAGSPVYFWDAESGRLAGTLEEGWNASTLAVSRDGRRLLSWGYTDGLAVWESGDPLAFEPRRLKGQARAVRAVAFSPNGGQIACGSEDKSLVLYGLLTGQPEANFPLPSPCVCLAFHPGGNQVALSDGDDRVALLDWTSGADPRHLEHTGEVLAVAYSPDGALLATGSKDRKARLWDVAAGKEVAVLADHDGQVSCVGFTPDGATLLTGSWDGKVRLWDVGSRSLRARLDLNVGAEDEGVSSLAVTGDGRFLLAGGMDGVAKVWDLRTTKQVASLRAHPKAVTALVVLPGGRVVSAGAEGDLHVWDLASGRTRNRLWVGGEGVLGLTRSRDGSRLAAGCRDGTARVFDRRWLEDRRRRYDP